MTRNPILYGRQAFCRPFLWCAFIHFCPKFVKKESLERSIQATGAKFKWGANSFDDLGEAGRGFRHVKDDNILRGMWTLSPAYKLVTWIPIMKTFAQKILVFEKA